MSFYLEKRFLVAHDAVFSAGNLVSRVFEHGRVLDEVADPVIQVVGPESAVGHNLADFVAIIVISDSLNTASGRASDNIVIRPHAISELGIRHDAIAVSAAAFCRIEICICFLVSSSFGCFQVAILSGLVEGYVLAFVGVFADFRTIEYRQNSFNSLIANKAVSSMSLEIIKAFQMAAVAAISRAHEFDIIVDIVFDVLDVFVQCTLVTISLPDEPFASSILEVFAGLLASRSGEDPSRIS